MNKTVTPGDLHGELRVLPSKSASHRAVMMAALARGKTLLEPMQLSKDIGSTLACAQALGLTRGAPCGSWIAGNPARRCAFSSRWRSTGAGRCA